MATKTFEELKQLAIQIRDEKTNKQNTATRVGTAMLEHINKLEQDYYDKAQTDEELKERDDKLTELDKKNSELIYSYIQSIHNYEKISNDRVEEGYYLNSIGEKVQHGNSKLYYYNVNIGVEYNIFSYGNALTYIGFLVDDKVVSEEKINDTEKFVFKAHTITAKSGALVVSCFNSTLLEEPIVCQEERGYPANVLINGSKSNVKNASNVIFNKYISGEDYTESALGSVYVYDIVNAGVYAIQTYGNLLLKIAELDDSFSVNKVLASASDSAKFQYNLLFINIDKACKIGVSFWKEEKGAQITKPYVCELKDFNLLSRSYLFYKGIIPCQESYIDKAIDQDSGNMFDAPSWRCMFVNVNGGESYKISKASYGIVEYLTDGTINAITNLGDTDLNDYELTTDKKTYKIGVTYRSHLSFVYKGNLQKNIINGIYDKFPENRMEDEFSLYSQNLNPVGNSLSTHNNSYNYYKFPLLPIWGWEYMAYWYNKLFEEEDINIGLEGDSITSGEWGEPYPDLGGYRAKCIKRIMAIGKYPGAVNIFNNGVGSRSCQEWAGTGNFYEYESDKETYPNGIIDKGMEKNPDLLICAYGMNDSRVNFKNTTIEQRIELFESAYTEVLKRVRGSESVNGRPAYNKDAEHLSIILCTPTNAKTDGTDYRGYKMWHQHTRSIIQKLCREYHCAFADFNMMTYDHNWSPNAIWGSQTQPPATLHTAKGYTLAYTSILQKLIYPIGLWNVE